MSIIEKIGSQTIYDCFFQKALHGILITDIKNGIVDANDKACDILGYSKTELIGLGTKDIVHPEDLEKASINDLANELRGKKVSVLNRRYKKANGDYLLVNVRVMNLEKKNMYIVFFQDISMHHETRRALEESERKYEKLFKNAGDAIFILRAQGKYAGKIMDTNPAAEMMHGYSRDELLNMYINDLDSNKDSSHVPERIEKMLSGEWLNTEIMHQRRDGSEFPVSVSAGVVEFGGEKYVLAFDRDISEQKKNQRKLKEQITFFQTLIDTIPSPIFHKDVDGKYTGCNKAFESYIGLTKKQIIGKSVYDLAPKELADVYKKADDDLFSSKGSQTYETQVRYADGSNHDVIFNKAVFLNTENKIGGMVGVIVDITERKNAERKKKELENQLYRTQKLEAIGTLASGIAHDFNNILSAIMGSSDLAKINSDNHEKLMKNLDQISSSSKRAADLVRHILTFSRETSKNKQPLKINLVVKDALKMLRSTIPSTIEIEESITSDSRILGDYTQVHQVVMNIVINAYQSLEDNPGILKISLKDKKVSSSDIINKLDMAPGEYIVLKVEDNGCGMGPKTIERIFDPYFTTKEKDRGTGLGLSTVHGIVTDHQGFIQVESNIGHGSIFHVFFPKTDTTQSEMTKAEISDVLPTGKERIMIVDDEIGILDSTKGFLEDHGYEAHMFSNGENALKAFKEKPDYFDLVISDIVMPRLTGDILSTNLLEIRPDLPIILCSGNLDRFLDQNTIDARIKKVISKPIDMTELMIQIRDAIDQTDIENR